MSHRYVIYERSSGRRAFKLALWAVLLGAAAYLGSEYGRADAAADISRTTAERNALRQRTETLESENASLREREAILQRAAQVERQAYTHVDETLKDLQDQILDLKEELAFYRGIISPEDGAAGLRQAKQVPALTVEHRLRAVQVFRFSYIYGVVKHNSAQIPLSKCSPPFGTVFFLKSFVSS